MLFQSFDHFNVNKFSADLAEFWLDVAEKEDIWSGKLDEASA